MNDIPEAEARSLLAQRTFANWTAIGRLKKFNQERLALQQG